LSCPKRTRAAVFARPNTPLEIREFPLAPPAAGELIVEVSCATICASDIHSWTGRRSTPTPTVLGHETIGRIIGMGATRDDEAPLDISGQPLSLGDRIVVPIFVACEHCWFCRKGIPQKCARLFKYGHEALTPSRGPTGGFAEHMHLLAGTRAVRVPAGVSDSIAAPAGCATATAAAAVRVAAVEPGEVVVISGAGMLGLTATALVRDRGASAIAIDPIAARRVRALEFGASAALDPIEARNDVREAVLAATEGRGADAVLELSGGTSAVTLALELVRIAGHVVLVGSVFPAAAVPVDSEQVVRRLLRIEGVHNYAPKDLEAAMSFVESSVGRLPLARLIGAEFPLDEIDDAFAHAMSAGPPRVAVRPQSIP
jgi:putative phosphonate catabolism associated alcohol dehydrogenase